MNASDRISAIVAGRPSTVRDAVNLVAPESSGAPTERIVAEAARRAGVHPDRHVRWDRGLLFEVMGAIADGLGQRTPEAELMSAVDGVLAPRTAGEAQATPAPAVKPA
jgi:hypothetical protein